MEANTVSGKKRKKRRAPLLVLILLVLAGAFYLQKQAVSNSDTLQQTDAGQTETSTDVIYDEEEPGTGTASITEDGEYTSGSDVAEYIHLYHHLPSNYVTKDQAESMGWHGGNPMNSIGRCIGGDRFGNYEGLLPKGKYFECDVDYSSGERGPCRLIYNSSGNVYYTRDHYESFEQLY